MSDRFLVATRKGLFTVQRGHSRLSPWSIVAEDFLGDNVSMVLPDRRDGSIWVGLDHGHFGVKLHVSRDGGATWAEATAPAFPPKPEGQEEVEPAGQRPIPWTVLRIWALEAGGDDDPDGLWCGTLPGGLFRSDDRGASWHLVRSLWDNPKRKEWFGGGAEFPGIHSISVEPGNSRRVTIGVSCGGVWITEDHGGTWTCRAEGMRAEYMPPERQFDPFIQDPHRVVQCPGDPKSFWAAHHNGVFRTTDGARSWQEITAQPSSFGFAVAVHPKQPDTAWLVPAESDQRRIPFEGRVVVSRTRDGGESFTVLSRGLPQQHAYDITYRHGLDIDSTGDHLALGSTTGNVWVTVDQGDTWQTVAEHLPPVYAVRWVGQRGSGAAAIVRAPRRCRGRPALHLRSVCHSRWADSAAVATTRIPPHPGGRLGSRDRARRLDLPPYTARKLAASPRRERWLLGQFYRALHSSDPLPRRAYS